MLIENDKSLSLEHGVMKNFSFGSWSHDVLESGIIVGSVLKTNDGRLFICLDEGVSPDGNFDLKLKRV